MVNLRLAARLMVLVGMIVALLGPIGTGRAGAQAPITA
jgi:hypothetical protein